MQPNSELIPFFRYAAKGLIWSEQRILTLRLAEDMDYSTISEKLGISETACRSQYSRTAALAPNLWKGVTTMQDSKQIDELFRLMDDVCENGDAAACARAVFCRRRRTRRKSTQKRRSKVQRPTIRNFFVKPHRGRRLCYRILLSRRLFSPQELCLRWLPDTIRSTMRRCGVRKHSASLSG